MLKLNKLTDYAVLVMAHLARQPEGAGMSATALAAETALPEPTVAKVLKSLSRAGLLLSARGIAGGYRLAQSPDITTVGEIVEAMDGPVAIVSCVDAGHENDCAVSSQCMMREKWAPVNRAIRAALHGVTLSEMSGMSLSQGRRVPVGFKPSAEREGSYAGHE